MKKEKEKKNTKGDKVKKEKDGKCVCEKVGTMEKEREHQRKERPQTQSKTQKEEGVRKINEERGRVASIRQKRKCWKRKEHFK